MELKDFITYTKSGEPIEINSEVHKYMFELSQEAMRITCELNGRYHSPTEIRTLMSKLTGKPIDQTILMFPPFYTDCGKNTTIGKNVFINSGCRFQDQGGIEIGNGTFIGHNVVLATLNHGIAPDDRSTIYPKPITIGNNVWIGASATILPGVVIGNNAVVAAGAVVAKSVKANTVVGGVPAKNIRVLD